MPGQEAAVLYSGGCLGRVSLFGLLKILSCLASPCLHWERELALQDCTRILTGLGTEASNQWSSYTDTSLARDLRALPSALSSVLGQELSRGVRLILAKAVSGLWAGEGRKCRPQQCQPRAPWHRQRHRGAAQRPLSCHCDLPPASPSPFTLLFSPLPTPS